MATVDFTAPAPPGYFATTINGLRYYGIEGMEMSASSDGVSFSHRGLDLIVGQRCAHCGHADLDRRPARSLAEAIERGYLVPVADVDA